MHFPFLFLIDRGCSKEEPHALSFVFSWEFSRTFMSIILNSSMLFYCSCINHSWASILWFVSLEPCTMWAIAPPYRKIRMSTESLWPIGHYPLYLYPLLSFYNFRVLWCKPWGACNGALLSLCVRQALLNDWLLSTVHHVRCHSR